jgi:hypothetical protein
MSFPPPPPAAAAVVPITPPSLLILCPFSPSPPLPLSLRFHRLKDHLTIPELISLHQAYYIKKTEFRVKWLLEHRLNQQLQLLSSLSSSTPSPTETGTGTAGEIHLNIKQLRDELQRIHPTNQTRVAVATAGGEEATGTGRAREEDGEGENLLRESQRLLRSTFQENQMERKALIRVCDIIQTEIVGVEVCSSLSPPLSCPSISFSVPLSLL